MSPPMQTLPGSERPSSTGGAGSLNDLHVDIVDTTNGNESSGGPHEIVGMSFLNVHIPGKIEDWSRDKKLLQICSKCRMCM
ncbi:unnamed protein product [Linum tenue]|uniref:Uncharacterized protein n=1 Tax=Linum tenue TaxID=586396 RepID=A0AAV0NI47_9ROSI|nr:unnamed protein product [Linum tenue]